MDQFEAARVKHAKNLERKMRTQGNAKEEVVAEIVEQPIVELPKEQKASPDAVIEVVVNLPHRTLSITLRKRHILQNVHPSRLTKEEFFKAIAKGLEPLM